MSQHLIARVGSVISKIEQGESLTMYGCYGFSAIEKIYQI